MANVISSLKLGSTVGVFAPPYATCSTAASTQAKTATVSDSGNFALETGAKVIVKFSYANTHSTPTLNVNSTGAKNIYYENAAFSDILAEQLYEFVYNGTQWVVLNPPAIWKTF